MDIEEEMTCVLVSECRKFKAKQCKKLIGEFAMEILRKYLKSDSRVSDKFDISEPNSFIRGHASECDLLVLIKGSKSQSDYARIFNYEDVHAIIEVKTKGVMGPKEMNNACKTITATEIGRKLYFTYSENDTLLKTTRELYATYGIHVSCLMNNSELKRLQESEVRLPIKHYSGEWEEFINAIIANA